MKVMMIHLSISIYLGTKNKKYCFLELSGCLKRDTYDSLASELRISKAKLQN